MSMHMFHTKCDVCGKPSAEYESFPWCNECMLDVCSDHWVPGTHNNETGRVLCTNCQKEAA